MKHISLKLRTSWLGYATIGHTGRDNFYIFLLHYDLGIFQGHLWALKSDSPYIFTCEWIPHVSMCGWDILCGISKVPAQNISHIHWKIWFVYNIEFLKPLDWRAHTRFWPPPQTIHQLTIVSINGLVYAPPCLMSWMTIAQFFITDAVFMACLKIDNILTHIETTRNHASAISHLVFYADFAIIHRNATSKSALVLVYMCIYLR